MRVLIIRNRYRKDRIRARAWAGTTLRLRQLFDRSAHLQTLMGRIRLAIAPT